jgi:hypothetical protein
VFLDPGYSASALRRMGPEPFDDRDRVEAERAAQQQMADSERLASVDLRASFAGAAAR